jgi:hypothetical protein
MDSIPVATYNTIMPRISEFYGTQTEKNGHKKARKVTKGDWKEQPPTRRREACGKLQFIFFSCLFVPFRG